MIEYFTVDRLNLKELTYLFSRIYIHPEVTYGGTPCWIWSLGRSKSGHGKALFRGTTVAVYRLTYAWLVQPLPRGFRHGELDHLCRNPMCCNPEHLEFVSRAVNLLRGNGVGGLNARKTHCIRGHALFGNNLRITTDGRRNCRTCKNQSQREKKIWRHEHLREAARLRKLRRTNARTQ